MKKAFNTCFMNTSHLAAFADWLKIERGYPLPPTHTVVCYSRDVSDFFQSIEKNIATEAITREHVNSDIVNKPWRKQ